MDQCFLNMVDPQRAGQEEVRGATAEGGSEQGTGSREGATRPSNGTSLTTAQATTGNRPSLENEVGSLAMNCAWCCVHIMDNISWLYRQGNPEGGFLRNAGERKRANEGAEGLCVTSQEEWVSNK